MNKKQLYESIMKSVAKEVKKALNESIDYKNQKITVNNNIDETVKFIKDSWNKANDIIIKKCARLGEIGSTMRFAGYQVAYDGFSSCTFYDNNFVYSASNFRDGKWSLSNKITAKNEYGDYYIYIDKLDNNRLLDTEAQQIADVYNKLVDFTNEYESKSNNHALNISELGITIRKEFRDIFKEFAWSGRDYSLLASYILKSNLINYAYFTINGKMLRIILLPKYNGSYGSLVVGSEFIYDNNKYSINDCLNFMQISDDSYLSPKAHIKKYGANPDSKWLVSAQTGRTLDRIKVCDTFDDAKLLAYKLAKEDYERIKNRRDSRSQYASFNETSDIHQAVYAQDYYNCDGHRAWYQVDEV